MHLTAKKGRDRSRKVKRISDLIYVFLNNDPTIYTFLTSDNPQVSVESTKDD